MKRILPLVFFIISLTTLAGAAPGLADEGQKVPNPPQKLILFTPYPAQETAIGENVTFGLTLRGGDTPQVVRLEMQDLPEGWTAAFRGGGKVIEAAYVDPSSDTSLELRVEPPADVKAGSYQFAVIGHSQNNDALKLPIELIIKDKLPPSLKFQADLPTLRGTPSTTFRFDTTLKNEGDEDMTINLAAEAPKGLQVDFKLSGQDVTSLPLAANESKHLSIEVKPFPDLAAGSYPIKVMAQGGETQAGLALTAEVTGQPELSVTAPDGRLSGQANAGSKTPLKLVVQNTGSAPAQNIALTASPPAGWKVEFEPKQIAEIPSGQQVEVTANVQPTDQAIAGDYVVTVRAQPEDGPSKSADFRITVLTSTMWGMAGVGLIAVAVAVVGVAVSRFGRR
ncbi:MAG: hypothetical protein KJ077_31115 [Anaerolineae bacterium]|nr:hypothetical protein [Anaerolineae bacterium]